MKQHDCQPLYSFIFIYLPSKAVACNWWGNIYPIYYYRVECTLRNATDFKTFWLHYSFFREFALISCRIKQLHSLIWPQMVKAAWAKTQLLTRLFHKWRKGVQAEQVVSERRGRRGLQRGGTGSRTIQVSGFHKACLYFIRTAEAWPSRFKEGFATNIPAELWRLRG